MSDTTTLSHEYEASAEFAEMVNKAVLRLKKSRLGRPGISQQELQEARTNMAGLLSSLAANFGGSGTSSKPPVAVPEEVLERLQARHANRISYFHDDLVDAAKEISQPKNIDDNVLKVLEEVSDAADATASASFRRLRRR